MNIAAFEMTREPSSLGIREELEELLKGHSHKKVTSIEEIYTGDILIIQLEGEFVVGRVGDFEVLQDSYTTLRANPASSEVTDQAFYFNYPYSLGKRSILIGMKERFSGKTMKITREDISSLNIYKIVLEG